MKTLLLCIVALFLVSCGDGGCDAGAPGFASAHDECAERAEPAASAASTPGR
jgi:hypothetical protein